MLLSYLLSFAFNATWAMPIQRYLGWPDPPEVWQYADTYPVQTLIFPQDDLMWAFVNNVAWGLTAFLISHVILGLTLFHTRLGERKQMNSSQMILGSFIMCMSIIAIMIPHLGFLVYQGLSDTWLQVSLIWLAMVHLMAFIAFILLYQQKD
jgi:hypothetical protein